MLIAFLQCLSDFSVDHPWWTSVLAVLVTANISKWIKSRRYRLPPGPSGLPIVGYLPFLGLNMHEDLMKLQQTYGGVFSLMLGSRYAVVLSDYKAVKEANTKDECSARPPGLFTISHNVNHLEDMKLRDWKESRQFTLSTLEAFGKGNNKIEEIMKKNIARVLSQFEAYIGRTEINLHSHVYKAVTNTVIQTICGNTKELNPNLIYTLETYARVLLDHFRAVSLGFFIPMLKPFLHLIKPELKEMKKELAQMESSMWKEIENHEKHFGESEPEDYMDFFIAEMKKRKLDPSTFTRQTLNGNSQVLLMAASDTVRTSIEWAILYMVKYPEIQERAHAAIVKVLGKDKSPSWNDRENIPYLDAIIMEVSRIKSISPLGEPKWTTADMQVNYYDIPKGTYIINNFHAIHMDPNLWDKPEEFNPDRFLTEDGTKIKNIEYLIPFGYGKRVCPGEKLANVMVFMFVASILQKFRIHPPHTGLNMTDIPKFVVYPTSPYIKVEKRE